MAGLKFSFEQVENKFEELFCDNEINTKEVETRFEKLVNGQGPIPKDVGEVFEDLFNGGSFKKGKNQKIEVILEDILEGIVNKVEEIQCEFQLPIFQPLQVSSYNQ